MTAMTTGMAGRHVEVRLIGDPAAVDATLATVTAPCTSGEVTR